MAPTAIGYVRQEFSTDDQFWHQIAMHRLAESWGYQLLPLLIVGPGVPAPTLLLVEHIRHHDVAAVFVPTREHIWAQRRAVTELCDLIVVDTVEAWKRGHRWPPIAPVADLRWGA